MGVQVAVAAEHPDRLHVVRVELVVRKGAHAHERIAPGQLRILFHDEREGERRDRVGEDFADVRTRPERVAFARAAADHPRFHRGLQGRESRPGEPSDAGRGRILP
ncbi:MAG: hypothetical protein C4321_08280 [Chloroflexota bacterium]